MGYTRRCQNIASKDIHSIIQHLIIFDLISSFYKKPIAYCMHFLKQIKAVVGLPSFGRSSLYPPNYLPKESCPNTALAYMQ